MKLFITRPIPEKIIEYLQTAKLQVNMRKQDSIISRAELIAMIKDCEVLFTFLTDPLDQEILAQAPKLRIIGQMAAGLDNIDLEFAKQKNIKICNTPGLLTEACADFTFALLLATARRIVEGHKMVAQNQFHGWGPQVLLGSPVYGKTLGIIGMGNIGSAVARRARGFDMPMLYTSRTRKPQLESHLGIQWQPMHKILRDVDFLCIHVPGGKETHHLIGEAELRMMKPSAILLNMSRGGVVDDTALVKALEQKWIAGAGLDVFEGEPQINPKLLHLSQVVLAPHIGSATQETRERMAMSVARQIVSFAGASS